MRVAAACHSAAGQLAAPIVQDASSLPTLRRHQIATVRSKHQEFLVCITLLQSVPEGVCLQLSKYRQQLPVAIAGRRCHFPAVLVFGYQALLLFQSLCHLSTSPSQT